MSPTEEVDTVTIGGKTMTIKAYVEEQEKKEKKKEIKKSHVEEVDKYSGAIHRPRKPKYLNEKKGFTDTRHWTKEQIEAENAKRKGVKEMGSRYDNLEDNPRYLLMVEIMKTQGNWYNPNELYKILSYKSTKPKSLQAVHSKIYNFFRQEDPDAPMMTRRKEPGTVGFIYKFKGDIENLKEVHEIAKEWWSKYLEWEHNIVKKRQENKGKKKEKEEETPAPETEPGSEWVGLKELDNLVDRIAEKVEDRVKVNLANLKLNVDGEVRILFGFVK